MQHTRDIKGLQGVELERMKRGKEKKHIIALLFGVYGVWYRVEWWTV